MNREDLMIGNKVFSVLKTYDGDRKQIVTIQCLHMNAAETVESGTWQYSQIEGLPITEDLLRSLGFEKYNDVFWKRGESEGWYLNSKGEITKSLSEFYVRCIYFHELQQLCHRLKF